MNTPMNIDVAALDPAHRQAMEDVIGRPLLESQMLIIQVSSPESANRAEQATKVLNLLTSFYHGLSDEEVETIDRAINVRADLYRPLP